MVIDLRTSRPCFVNGEGSSIPHNDSTRIETDVTNFHGLGPLSGSAIRETCSGVFRIRRVKSHDLTWSVTFLETSSVLSVTSVASVFHRSRRWCSSENAKKSTCSHEPPTATRLTALIVEANRLLAVSWENHPSQSWWKKHLY